MSEAPAPSAAHPQVDWADGSGAMFDRIAGRYDLLNGLLTFGQDKRWRQRVVPYFAEAGEGPLLDLATGTADLALLLAQHYPDRQIIGVDPSPRMLQQGQAKVQAALKGAHCALTLGDARALPYPDNHFAGCAMAFGIRNVPDRATALREIKRVCQPQAPVIILELGQPRGPQLLHRLARFYINRFVPLLGQLFSGKAAYDYLTQSMAYFPPPDEFLEEMAAVGMGSLQYQTMHFGSVYLYSGKC